MRVPRQCWGNDGGGWSFIKVTVQLDESGRLNRRGGGMALRAHDGREEEGGSRGGGLSR